MCQDQGWLKSTLDISWLIACVHICSLSNLPFLAGKSPIFRYSITIMAMTSPSSGLSSWQSQATETTRTQPGVEWTSLVNSARLNMAEHDPQRSPFRPEIHIPGSWNQVAPPCWNAPGWVKEDLLARTLAYLGMACNGPTTISRTETTNGSDHMSTKHQGHPGATLAKLHHLHDGPIARAWDMTCTAALRAPWTFPAGSSPFPLLWKWSALFQRLDDDGWIWPNSWRSLRCWTSAEDHTCHQLKVSFC